MREIIAREVLHNGKKRVRVNIPRKLNSGKKGRRYFTGKNAKRLGDRFAATLEAMRAKAGFRLMALPQEKQVALMHAADVMGDRLLEIGEAVRLYMAKKQAVNVPLGQVIAECIAEKRTRKLSKSYISGFRSTLERFALGKESSPMDEITADQVRQHIGRLKEPVSQNSELTDLRALFSFANRHYGVEHVAKLVPFAKVIRKEPGILTIEQIKTLLRGIHSKHPDLMRYVTLTLFAGVRPDEAKQLTDDCVKGGYIVVPASIVKGNRKRRLVKANDTFLAWWKLGGKLPIKKHQVQLVHDIIQPWPHDALRHSFVSYHGAIHGEVATSTEAGHSVKVSEDHYKATVTREDAEALWAMRPENVLPEFATVKSL